MVSIVSWALFAMITKEQLEDLYIGQSLSIQKLTTILGLPRQIITDKLVEYEIPIRTKSETSYLQHNKVSHIIEPRTRDELMLYGLGLGLYWGEGNKVDTNSVRLGNTDPYVIVNFVKFLKIICGVPDSDIKYGLQVFNDADPDDSIQFWQDILHCGRESFHKTISIIPPQGKGIYNRKSKHGVVQVYVCNKKLKTWLMCELGKYAAIAQG